MSDFAAAPSAPAPSTTNTSGNTTNNSGGSAPSTNTQTNLTSAQSTGAPKTGAPNNTTTPNSKLADAPPEAPKPGETKAQAEARRKYKLKVDGAEQELELSDVEVSTRLQKALAAEKRMAQAAETQKAFKAFQEAFKSDPFEAAKHLHPDMDLDALAEKRLIERFQQEELQKQDPAAYERAQLQKQLDEYKSKEQKAQEAAKAKAQADHDAKVGQEMERDFMQALELSGLPKDRQYLRMMAEVADTALDNDIELSPAQMAAEVNSRIREQHQHVTRGLKGETLIKHLGDDVVREVLRYSVEKHKAKQSVVTAPTARGEETPEQRETRKLKTGSEARKFFNDMKSGR
jgi:hypothetical protein